MAASGGVQVTPKQLQEKYNEIEALDEWLEAAAGADSQGRISLRNSWVKDSEDFTNNIVEQLIAALDKQNATQEFRAGVYFGLNKALKSALGEPAEKFLDAEAEKNKSETETPAVSAEEIAEKREARKQLVTQFNALKGILEMFGMEEAIADIPTPKVLRGAIKGQTRGPRKINLMTFFVDGEQVPEDKNSLSGVAEILGNGLKAKDVRAALKGAGVDTANPKDFSVEIGGKVVSATGGVEDESDDEGDEPEDDGDE